MQNTTPTKDMIANALFTLMRKKAFTSITIKELTDEADVARRTFYKNFKSKDDVVDYWLKQVDRLFTKELNEKLPQNPEAYGRIFFAFFKNYSAELRALHKNTLLFSSVYYMYMDTMNEHSEFVDAYKMYNSPFNIAYRFGGIFFMLIEWVENGMEPSPEEMAKYLAKEIPPET